MDSDCLVRTTQIDREVEPRVCDRSIDQHHYHDGMMNEEVVGGMNAGLGGSDRSDACLRHGRLAGCQLGLCRQQWEREGSGDEQSRTGEGSGDEQSRTGERESDFFFTRGTVCKCNRWHWWVIIPKSMFRLIRLVIRASLEEL